MLLSKSEYFKYMESHYDERYLERYLKYEVDRVGFSTYVRPPSNPNSNGFRYSTYPNKVRYFKLCLDNIINPQINTTFRVRQIPTNFQSKLNELKIDEIRTHHLLEVVIPFLKNDIQLSKKFNNSFSNKENIRGIFHIIFESYPIGYFDKVENIEQITLDMIS